MLAQKYNPQEVEAGKYQKWVEKGYFNCGDQAKPPYCIVIPPPNVTGKLHLGHAMDNTIQDLLCRYHRLKGYDVLWIPGMDHAGIATQAKVDERLRNEGISRYDLGRDKFLERAWHWKSEYSALIRAQWAKLGISVDYRKERFTLDEGLSKAVTKAFVKYYKEGLIYQGKRIINWDPVAKTALSNIEVIHKEVAGKMYYFRYKLVGETETFTVATTRPETMFGDVCVVVNPRDERLAHLIGKRCLNPANGAVLPIIGDEYIEIGFGTGAMKCTPAHDPNDYQIALRHHLAMPICMNEDGSMNELCGEFEGLDRYACREALIAKFKAEGSFVKEEDIVHNVGHSERTGVMVEPYLSKQWFVKTKPLAEAVLALQKDPTKKINFYPARFETTFINWLSNIEDWCISRQLWWGHRIPVWYRKGTGEIYCEEEAPADRENYFQDEDVLDTWFSSALWPFSTLGWPEETDDYRRYYPTSCMVTGYDIIFFWVARMAFSSCHFTGERPFEDCLIHGLIRDEQGRKMSKSLGNGIDPLEVIDEYGCDSLRYFLSTNSTPGLDMNFSKLKLEAAWNFINKLWNAARYVLMNIDADYARHPLKLVNETDHWIIAKLNQTIKQVSKNLDRYEFAIAGNELESFVWNDFCANYIEFSKIDLKSSDPAIKHRALDNLLYVLEAIVTMLHPYIPFVTEEIYQAIHSAEDSLNQARWPQADVTYDAAAASQVDTLIAIIKEVRELRRENDLKASAILSMKADVGFTLSRNLSDILFKMCKIKAVSTLEGETIVRPLGKQRISFALNEVVDRSQEIAKIEKELAFHAQERDRSAKILSNRNFLSKAPAAKVAEEKAKLGKHTAAYATLAAKLAEIKNRGE